MDGSDDFPFHTGDFQEVLVGPCMPFSMDRYFFSDYMLSKRTMVVIRLVTDKKTAPRWFAPLMGPCHGEICQGENLRKMVGAPWDGSTLNSQPHIHLIYIVGICMYL